MKTVFSILILGVVTTILPLFILIQRIDQYILQPEPLLQALEEENIYETIVPILIQDYFPESVFDGFGLTGVVEYTEIQDLLNRMFNPEWLRQNLSSLIREIYTLRVSTTQISELQLYIDLREPKIVFVDIVARYLERAKKELPTTPTFGESEFPIDADFIATFLPDSINLLRFFLPQNTAVTHSDDLDLDRLSRSLTPDEKESLGKVQTQLTVLQKIIRIAHYTTIPVLGVLIILILVVCIIHRNHSVGMFVWGGLNLVFPGVVLLCAGSAPSLLNRYGLLDFQFTAELSLELREMIHALVFTYSKGFMASIQIIGTILSVLALLCFIIAGVRYFRLNKTL